MKHNGFFIQNLNTGDLIQSKFLKSKIFEVVSIGFAKAFIKDIQTNRQYEIYSLQNYKPLRVANLSRKDYMET